MADVSHSLTQRGLPMETRRFAHPPIIRDMSRLFNNNLGRVRRSDAHGNMDAGVSTISAVTAAGSLASRTMKAISSLKALRSRSKRGHRGANIRAYCMIKEDAVFMPDALGYPRGTRRYHGNLIPTCAVRSVAPLTALMCSFATV